MDHSKYRFKFSGSKSDNQIVIGWDRDGMVTMIIAGEPLSFNISNPEYYFAGWHRHCFTWKSNDTIWVRFYLHI